MSFLGFPRANGTAGVRNYVLIIPGGLVSTKICEFVNGTRTVITADGGSGRTKRDRETIARTLVGLGKNPNVAGVILHGIGLGSGYPELKPEVLGSQIAQTGKPVEVISGKQEPDAFKVIEGGIRVARKMVQDASHSRRELLDDGHLAVAVKCGRSDATSGIAGNPAVGYLFDHVVGAGGTAFFGENTEIIGAEHILAKRAISEEVGREIVNVALATEERAKSVGEDIRSINPVPSNIAGGISTLEEKSLGAIAKAGTAPIQGVLRYAEVPPAKGLYFVDNWMTQLSIFLGYAAAGATVTLYQLGGGGFLEDTFLSPSLGVVAPLLWATANTNTFQAAWESIDFYSGTVIEGKETLEEAGGRLCDLVRQVASGSLTKTETLKYQDPSQVYLQDSPF
jgi:altronate dehydratase large subunit